jgi:hypothetical protein
MEERRKLGRTQNEILITKIINTASNKLWVDISNETRLKVSRQLRYTCSDVEKLTKILENIKKINKDVDLEIQKNVTLILEIIENWKREKWLFEKVKNFFWL